jgi:hypothetical protein
MYGWELIYKDFAVNNRAAEIEEVGKRTHVKATTFAFYLGGYVIQILVIFSVYVWMGEKLSASLVFTVSTIVYAVNHLTFGYSASGLTYFN